MEVRNTSEMVDLMSRRKMFNRNFGGGRGNRGAGSGRGAGGGNKPGSGPTGTVLPKMWL
jgi:hypothetical protein